LIVYFASAFLPDHCPSSIMRRLLRAMQAARLVQPHRAFSPKDYPVADKPSFRICSFVSPLTLTLFSWRRSGRDWHLGQLDIKHR
jgi:hypothetical protein